MIRGFWDKLKKPVVVLAPMANVTDAAFRSIIAKNGKPDVMWTEFVSADGLCSPGREKLLVDLRYSDAERPIVAQIFGANPENIMKASQLVADMGYDGVDINMGCPDKSVEKQCAGAAAMKDHKLALEIIAAAKDGAPNLPVSVKTRLGFNKVEIQTWIPNLLQANLAALTVHLRTRKEMSKVPAHWELMPQIRDIVNSVAIKDRPLLLGNGDVLTLAEAVVKIEESGCDGVMIGRGIFGNPWCFNPSKQVIPTSERMRAMLQHTRLFEKEFAGIKNFEVMKKHYKAYVNGFDGAKELRMELMSAENSADVERIIFQHYPVLQKNLA